MKSILLPTDFSAVSANAADYAAELALETSSRLVLMHVCTVPYIAVESAVFIPEFEVNESMKMLAGLQDRLNLKFGSRLEMECVCRTGNTVDAIINDYASENNIHLVVMGMHGAGYLEEKLLGSNVTSVIRNSRTPVLVVNEKNTFRPVKRIVLASDNTELPKLDPVKDIISLYNSRIYVLHIIREFGDGTPPNMHHIIQGIRTMLAGIDHSFHFEANKDTVEGINIFAASVEADMVILIPHHHAFPGNIFHESNTKRMAFHSEVPMLAIQE
jgi:nucleotide-binding universal stress UspA family protein